MSAMDWDVRFSAMRASSKGDELSLTCPVTGLLICGNLSYRQVGRDSWLVVLGEQRNQSLLRSQDDFHAPVQGPAGGAVIGRTRHVRADPLEQQAVALQAAETEDRGHGLGAILAELAVVFEAT